MVDGGCGGAVTLDRFATALARRIVRETGLDARAHGPGRKEPEPGSEVLVWAGLPGPSARDAAVDLVLMLEGERPANAGPSWRDALIAAGLPWACVGGWTDNIAALAVDGASLAPRIGAPGGVFDAALDDAVGTALDTALHTALDAAAPLLRRRARPGAGLFTRLAHRNAEHAGWRWACESCDVPECEHALRVASRMDTGPTLR